MASKSKKQLLVDEIAAILEIKRDELGNGSKEHLRFLQDIGAALGLSPTGRKHALARQIVEHLGGEWTRECYSRGDSVQSHCFRIIRAALGSRMGTGQADFMVAISRARACMQPGDPPPQGNRQPLRLEGPGSDFVRCPEVVAWILMRAGGVCELCGEAAPFERADRTPYLEVHHVRPLADGGPDTVDNAVALCPTCHRAVHHAHDRRDRRNQLSDRVRIRGYGSPDPRLGRD
jgi:5-methylcytosine-specific restriction endonuclease McrA